MTAYGQFAKELAFQEKSAAVCPALRLVGVSETCAAGSLQEGLAASKQPIQAVYSNPSAFALVALAQ